MDQKGLPKANDILEELGCAEKSSCDNNPFDELQGFNFEAAPDLSERKDDNFDDIFGDIEMKKKKDEANGQTIKGDHITTTTTLPNNNEEQNGQKIHYERTTSPLSIPSLRNFAMRENASHLQPSNPLRLNLRLPGSNSPSNHNSSRIDNWVKSSPPGQNSNVINSHNVFINTNQPNSPLGEAHAAFNRPVSCFRRNVENQVPGGFSSILEADSSPRPFQPNMASPVEQQKSTSMNGSRGWYSVPENGFRGGYGDSLLNFEDTRTGPKSPSLERHKKTKRNEKGLDDQQYKMLQSVKLMQRQSQFSGDNGFSETSMGNSNSPMSPISPISPVSNNLGGVFREQNYVSNGGNLHGACDYSVLDNNNNSYIVRKCSEELLEIKPSYQMAIQTMKKAGVEEVGVFEKTVKLYSRILCTWKRHSVNAQKRLLDTLVEAQQRLESEMFKGHRNLAEYKRQMEAMTHRNNVLEINVKTAEKKIILEKHKNRMAKCTITDELTEKITNYQKHIMSLKEELSHTKNLNEKLSKANDSINSNSPENTGFAINTQQTNNCNGEAFARSLTKIKGSIDKIAMIKKNTRALCLNDSRNLNSPLIKPDLNAIRENFKKDCSEVVRLLSKENLFEDFLINDTSKKRVKAANDSIEVSKILDKRVSPDGNVHFYVSCPLNPRSLTPTSCESVQSSLDEGSDPGSAFCERVWVNEQNLAGCEDKIREFHERRNNMCD